MKKINLAQSHWKILKAEFPQVSRQTIYTSLRYFNDSPTARAIRKRAKELLVKEANEVIV